MSKYKNTKKQLHIKWNIYNVYKAGDSGQIPDINSSIVVINKMARTAGRVGRQDIEAVIMGFKGKRISVQR